MRLYLQNRAIKPGFDEIYSSHLYFKDILRIRKSTPLFRLRTGREVKERVKFYNAGADQHAFIAMAILDREQPALDAEVKSVVVFFNVDKTQKSNNSARLCWHSFRIASGPSAVVGGSRGKAGSV